MRTSRLAIITIITESTIMRDRYLEVFQVCDSTFPIGTFNHSFGMENYLSRRKIRKAPQFAEWIRNYYRSQFRYGEGLLVILCYRALDEGAPEKLLTYDEIMHASTVARETREGTVLIASRMLSLIRNMYGEAVPYLSEYERCIKEKKAYGNPAIVFSLFAHAEGIPCDETFRMYGYSVASTLVQNAVRSVPLGQNAGQLILHDLLGEIGALYEETKDLDADMLGTGIPGLEMAQILHETQNARLFMS
jgi:urease accessory protein